LFQQDWEGNTVWTFNRAEQIRNDDGSTFWSARQHHDWQREGMPGGYYSPEADPQVMNARTLVLAHKNVVVPAITDKALEDDRLIEVSWDGEILWEWNASDHVEELAIPADARAVIKTGAGYSDLRGSMDWLHVNSATYVGPNRWYDAGDERFHPDNVIIRARYINLTAIVSRADGSIVWRIGPDFRETEAMSAIGQVIGQHNPHVVPKGLPGAGNLLLFDNGGSAGYAAPNAVSPSGVNALGRADSRVLEIDPITLEVVWSYAMPGRESFKFFSHYISNIQRLENGNTMITEGADGRLFEVAANGDIVWEYVSPYFAEREAPSNAVYRAYRMPYGWVPQVEAPAERAVVPPALSDFRIPSQ
jgi:hypothetical protein